MCELTFIKSSVGMRWMKKRFETVQRVHAEMSYAHELTQIPWRGLGRTTVTAKTSKVECFECENRAKKVASPRGDWWIIIYVHLPRLYPQIVSACNCDHPPPSV